MGHLEIPDHVAVQFFRTYLDGTPTSGVYNARCIVCGDSITNKHKKRLYLIKKDSDWIIYCHNCGYSSKLLPFVKTYFPLQYDNMLKQSLSTFFNITKTKKDENIELKKEIDLAVSQIQKKLNDKTIVEQYIETNCISFKDYDKSEHKQILDEQVSILKKRRLSNNFIDTLYYDINGKYKDRIIFPFYNNENKIYYFQARTTKNNASKYLNWKDGNKEEEEVKPEYNEYFIDKEQPVYILEGLIDSLFIKNSIAILGISMSYYKLMYLKNKYPKRIWLMDNDNIGKQTTEKLLNKNETCVIFPSKYNHIKDLNDLAILLEKDDLTEIIKNWSYNSINGILELGRNK